MKKKKTLDLKAVFVGDPNVGKTSIMRRYVEKDYMDNYQMTIGVDF